MAEYVNYLRVFGAPGAARALFGAIQDDTAGWAVWISTG